MKLTSLFFILIILNISYAEEALKEDKKTGKLKIDLTVYQKPIAKFFEKMDACFKNEKENYKCKNRFFQRIQRKEQSTKRACDFIPRASSITKKMCEEAYDKKSLTNLKKCYFLGK